MHTFKKALSMLVAMTMIVACIATLCIPASAAKKTDIERDGLVVWYDASNNSNGLQDHETTVWKDLTGNGNHMTVKLDENNYWTDNAFHVTNNPTYFPDAVVGVVNGEEYTFEMVLGEVNFTATNWITLMCSDNDEFSLFVRVPNGEDTDDNLEFKYNDKNQDRPKMDDGAALLNNSTMAVTFTMVDGEDPLCTIYVNGVALASGVPEHTNIADTLMWGHDNPQRAWGGDVYGFRFYNRCLTPDEIADNSSADEKNYRNGNYFDPEVEYDDSDEVIGGEDGITYTNNIVTINENTDLIPAIGEYGCTNVHNLHFYSEEHQGAKLIPTTNDDGTITGNPKLYVNYAKFVRRAGLENLMAEDVKYIAVKLKVVGEIEDLLIWGLSGEYHSTYEGPSNLMADDFPACNGETEYMLFNMEDAWTGLINQFAFEIVNPNPEAVVYIEEIALFADQASAYAYAGTELETEASTEENTEDETDASTDAPETNAATDAPATEAPTTESEGGCGSVIGFGAIALLAAAAAAVALKKD
ncbi:MAG: hypothetical protein J6K29_03080 [Clostridia bacterium]|nr:hypothetical protein [Clostridia bacterium]